MATKTQLKIISYLLDHKEKLLGIRELAREISSAYYLVRKNILQLKSRGIVVIQRAGKTDLLSLSKPLSHPFLIEAENFKREHFFKKYPSLRITLQKIIEQASSSFFILLVFGSYTKQPRQDSDLDLLIITPTTQQAGLIQKAISSVARTSPLKIHETILTEKTFQSLLQKKELNVVTEALEKSILIYGAENYYKLLQV